jgi:thiamine biosynthesis lipoprotein
VWLPPAEPAWRIGLVAGPGDQNLLGQIAVSAGGVATSGVTRRCWQTSSGWQHHLIDPRTGKPALTDLLSVSVVAPAAALAEAAAKAALLLGAEAGAAALERTGVLGGVLVLHNGEIKTAGVLSWQPATPAQRGFAS